ncbi:helix-turn-helix domain-containing protein [Desulfofundulus thermocisternus]|uniref:helix-turn-helix domain-containing protein n=1 Tax=Desulfofundulus thermocisternus TaxID=42471 RepID=UPI00217E22BE|nr:helix-turn-helix domain-containing protein [Desulfofundulus thermocisternus]MCS5696339.1 helix-turn-helix domain-containing protein [Desulfofundulus thermocisternus]
MRLSRSGKRDRISLESVDDFFTPRELAKILGVSEGHAYALAKSPGFPVMRIGRRFLISKQGLIRWLRDRGLA